MDDGLCGMDVAMAGAYGHAMTGNPLMTVAAAVLVVACVGGPGPDHYAAALDRLAIPPDWDLAKTEVRAPDAEIPCDPSVNAGCPAAVRYYLVDTTAIEAYRMAKQAVTNAGYETRREFDAEACDAPPSAPACAFFAAKDAVQVIVNIYDKGTDDGTGVAQTDRVNVRITAQP